mgnify:CR=1 FL=1
MSGSRTTPDAVAGWVGRTPARLRPYLRLMRADRPAGFWLLMWPCWWSVALARPIDDIAALWLLGLFLIGAIVMRGAGCVWNDILDREFDAQVARTAARPIPAGEVSVARAAAFMVLLSLIGLVVLLQFNRFAVWLGVSSLALVAVYPLAKRVTHWPQAVLGLTFNWGALMGWAAVHGALGPAPLVLYAGCLAWTLGYDTIYAHQDRSDDAVAGIKSTALKLGGRSKPWIAGFYATFVAALATAGFLAGHSWPFYAALLPAALHLGWQLRRLDPADAANCLTLFRANARFGWLVFLAMAFGHLGS